MKQQKFPEHNRSVDQYGREITRTDEVVSVVAVMAMLGTLGAGIYGGGKSILDAHERSEDKKHIAVEKIMSQLETNGTTFDVAVGESGRAVKELPAISFDEDDLKEYEKQKQSDINTLSVNKLGKLHGVRLPDDFHHRTSGGGIGFIPNGSFPGAIYPKGSQTEKVEPVITFNVVTNMDIKPEDADDYVVHAALNKLVPGTTATAFYQPSEHSIFLEVTMPAEHKDVELMYFAERAE